MAGEAGGEARGGVREVLAELWVRREPVVEGGDAGDARRCVGEVVWVRRVEQGGCGGFCFVEGGAGIAPGAAVDESFIICMNNKYILVGGGGA